MSLLLSLVSSVCRLVVSSGPTTRRSPVMFLQWGVVVCSSVSQKNFRVRSFLQWCFFRIFRSSACSPVVFLPNFSEFRLFSCGVSSGFLRTLNYFLWLPLLPSSVDSPEKKVQPLLNFCSLALFLSLSIMSRARSRSTSRSCLALFIWTLYRGLRPCEVDFTPRQLVQERDCSQRWAARLAN